MTLSGGHLPTLMSSNCLLAQLSRWQRMGDGLRGPGTRIELSEILTYSIVLALVGMLIWAALRLRKRNDMNQRCDDPWKLFRELCQHHGLDRFERRLLKKLVSARQLQQPAELFVTPSVFDPAGLPSDLNEDKVRNMKARLYYRDEQ